MATIATAKKNGNLNLHFPVKLSYHITPITVVAIIDIALALALALALLSLGVAHSLAQFSTSNTRTRYI